MSSQTSVILTHMIIALRLKLKTRGSGGILIFKWKSSRDSFRKDAAKADAFQELYPVVQLHYKTNNANCKKTF